MNLKLFLAILLLSFPRPVLSGSIPEKTEFTGRVVGVLDGDTLEVMHNGRAERIRLYGIDCPEKSQAFGQKAKQFASRMAYGKTVKVAVVDTDRYDRTIGKVFLPDGSNLNHELVRNGQAWWYRRYAPGDEDLERFENEARASKIGLWADKNPTPPWEFRRYQVDKRNMGYEPVTNTGGTR